MNPLIDGPTAKFSRLACDRCGWHHELNAFAPGSKVVVANGFRVERFAGVSGVVREWSQYNSALWVRVLFADGRRENFSPCELEHL
jgi:hypothetical protein